jgi:cytochrome o ubiquinol oxidase operon protein cyoD
MGRASSAFRFAAPVLLGLAVLLRLVLRPVLRPVLRLPAAGRGRAAGAAAASPDPEASRDAMSQDPAAASGHTDKAPGADEADDPLHSYLVGFALACGLTLASFGLANTGLIWEPAIPVVLMVLAVAQMGVHLVFFLHLGSGPDQTNNVMALAFGLLIVALVLVGSLWIMAHLNGTMMPMSPRLGG